MSKSIFISYAHEDKDWLDDLLVALAPLSRRQDVDVWSDRDIQPGEIWADQIEAHLSQANVAVLLVSAYFLASDFIATTELPTIVDAAKAGRVTLMWVPVSASDWESTPLADFQAVISPAKPLDAMTDAAAKAALVTVAKRIAGGRTLTDMSRMLQVADAVADPIGEAVGVPPSGRPHSVNARHTGETIEFEDASGHSLETITADDLADLDPEAHRLIDSLEQHMYDRYEKWTELNSRRSRLTSSEQREYEEAGRDMCRDLENILDFLANELQKYLHDHYNGVRFSCSKLVAGAAS